MPSLRQLTTESGSANSDPESNSREIEYLLTGAATYSAALSHAVANVPKYAGGLFRDSVTPEAIDDGRDGTWLVKAKYRQPRPGDEEESGDPADDWIHTGTSFEIVSPLKKMSHSKETISEHAAPGVSATPPDFKRGLNIDDKGVPQGAEISLDGIPVSLQYDVKASLITDLYLAAVEAAVLKTNSATFKGRAAGEVIFVGLRGTVDPQKDRCSLTYEFVVNKNQTGLTIGVFTGISKKGWEYAWIFSRKKDTDEGPIDLGRFLYIERLFDETDLAAALGI